MSWLSQLVLTRALKVFDAMVRLVALAAGVYVYKEPPKGLVGKARDDVVVRHAYIESTRPLLLPLEGRTL